MADQETEEPSIEEILTSIRQIISDDDEEGEGDDAPAEEKVMDYSEDEETRESDLDLTPEDEDAASSDLDLSAEEEEGRDSDLDLSADEEEVIELTEPVEEEVAPEQEVADDPDPEPEPEPEIEVDLQDVEPEIETSDAVTDDDSFSESVLTDEAKAAALESFTDLAKKTAVEHNGITLEDIVRSELNPLLRDWLDKNLPSIIERLVQEELDKIAKRATEND